MERKSSKRFSQKQNLLNQSNLYHKQIIQHKVQIPFNKIPSSLVSYFEEHARKNIMGKCYKEGYIFYDEGGKNVKVVAYTSGIMNSSHVDFIVLYEFDVCYPYEDMEIMCKVDSVTKIGIKAILSNDEKKNPIVIFASRIHNTKFFESNNGENSGSESLEGKIIKVKLIGSRFEVNDTYLSILGEIIE